MPSEGADPHTTDQYTRIIDHVANVEGINEQFSKACELAAVSGMVLMQPYLDFHGADPAQGQLKVKIWEYNSFMVDPYFRDPSMADCDFVWCQEYISKPEALRRYPGQKSIISTMSGTPQRYGTFYFLPENYNMARNDLLVLSHVWYKWTKKKKQLYSAERHQFFEYAGGQEQLDEILYNIPDLETVEIEVQCWKLALVLNDQLIFQGEDPLGLDMCPFIPVFWNYEPHINYYELRVRSLVRSMRDPAFLLNRRIILNHDISESSVNSGWMRKVGAVANEENLKKSGQGYDVLINEEYQVGVDCQKIIPNAVPPSDMQLADQMASLIFSVSGIDMENWSAQDDAQVSSLTVLLKQAANLMVLQKYFDQWDMSLKLLGERLLKVVLVNWNHSKVGLILGEEPSPHFYSRIFARYQTIVAEGLNTATQKHQEYQQWLELNVALGGIIPPSEIAKRAVIQGKNELMEILSNMEQQQQAVQEHATTVAHALEEAKIKELYSKAMSNLATARERHGRAEADIGLFEERLSEITHNRAMATKAKMEALEKMVDVIAKYGEVETAIKMHQLQSFDNAQEATEDREKADAKLTAMANEFVAQMMQENSPPQQQQQMQQQEAG
jgi:hypothetical protein